MEPAAPLHPEILRTPALPDRAFAALLTILYLLVLIPYVWHHGIWRDEAQAFLIARDSGSLQNLFFNMRFEGHPPLWYLLLYLLTRLIPTPGSMQILHVVIATSSVYLVTRFAPLSRLARKLFPFGSFILFEYGTIARNYQLVLLLSVIFCLLWTLRRNTVITQAIVLTLLSFSHAFGIILTTAFGAMILADAIMTRNPNRQCPYPKRRVALGGAITIAGSIASAFLTVPSHGGTYANGWSFDLNPAHVAITLSTLCHAYVPLAPWSMVFFNNSWFSNDSAPWVGVLAGIAGILCVSRSWRAILFLVIADVGLLTFFQVKYEGHWWHHGVLFIAWIAALWIAWSDAAPLSALSKRPFFTKLSHNIIVLMLGIQAVGVISPLFFCAQNEFSCGRETAAFIQQELRPDDILVSDFSLYTTPVSAYLPRLLFYFPAEQRWGTFTLWSSNWTVGATSAQIFNFAASQHHRIILLHCSPRGTLPGTEKLRVFYPSLAGETYSVFIIPAGYATTAPATDSHP